MTEPEKWMENGEYVAYDDRQSVWYWHDMPVSVRDQGAKSSGMAYAAGAALERTLYVQRRKPSSKVLDYFAFKEKYQPMLKGKL